MWAIYRLRYAFICSLYCTKTQSLWNYVLTVNYFAYWHACEWQGVTGFASQLLAVHLKPFKTTTDRTTQIFSPSFTDFASHLFSQYHAPSLWRTCMASKTQEAAGCSQYPILSSTIYYAKCKPFPKLLFSRKHRILLLAICSSVPYAFLFVL